MHEEGAREEAQERQYQGLRREYPRTKRATLQIPDPPEATQVDRRPRLEPPGRVRD